MRTITGRDDGNSCVHRARRELASRARRVRARGWLREMRGMCGLRAGRGLGARSASLRHCGRPCGHYNPFRSIVVNGGGGWSERTPFGSAVSAGTGARAARAAPAMIDRAH